jgi:hypothetical protein
VIYLHTGLPGDGKTLFTLSNVIDRAKAEQRQVFYYGIPELSVEGWTELTEQEMTEWWLLPEKAIIVCDEAQKLFRPRLGRGEPPEHVAQLETHRHKGFDIYLITQHPSLIDGNVRRLTGAHRHIVRSFGLQRSTIHEWGEVHLDCERRRADSSKTTFNFPRHIYKLYHSADSHTHGAKVPKQLWYAIGGLLLAGALVYYVIHRASDRIHAPADFNPAMKLSGLAPGTMAETKEQKVLTKAQWLEAMTPRIPDFDFTAPRYDEVTKPTKAPFPAGCYVSKTTGCHCMTDQGSSLSISEKVCINIVKNGIFKDFDDSLKVKSEEGVPVNRGVKGDSAPPASAAVSPIAFEPEATKLQPTYVSPSVVGIFGHSGPRLNPLGG